MEDAERSKEELIEELSELRRRISDLESAGELVTEALRESEASVKSILAAAPIGIGLVQNRVLGWVSERMNEMLGYSGDELIGKNQLILYENKEEFERVGGDRYEQIDQQGIGKIDTRL